MKQSELKALLESLTIDEKIGQLVQLSADFFDDSLNTTETGPSTKIGLAKSYNLYETGSLLNVLDPNVIRKLQKNYLEKSRHKIPLLFMSDIIYGFHTIFPIPLAQSCSWDFDLIKECAAISAEEAYYAGQQVTFSPMVDLVRDPRWGRVMEAPGEDPYIGSMFSKSVVEGLQGDGDEKIAPKKLAACVKHFAAYGAAEAGREYNGVDMSLSKFYGQYLPAFKAAIDANVKLVMTAFNTLNGVPATGNRWLNKEVLRQELGFKGLLITDYAANEELITHGYAANPQDAAKQALAAGVDIDMKTAIYANNMKDLLANKQIEMTLIDSAVARVLKLKNELGLFENPYRGLEDQSERRAEDLRLEKALELAEKSAVLLKNNGVLPLENKGKIAIIGPYADSPDTLGMWAINGDTTKTVTLKSGMMERFNQAEIVVSKGAPMIINKERLGFSTHIKQKNQSISEVNPENSLNEALLIARKADKIIVAFGEHVLESGEGGSKTNLSFSAEQLEMIDHLSQLGKPIIGIVYSGRPNNLSQVIEKFDALIYAWYPGTMGGLAVANLLSGVTNPSGKLTMSFPKNEGQIPIYYNGYRTGRPLKDEKLMQRFTSRYIDEQNAPLFPFGFGLSYAQFNYTSIKVSSLKLTEEKTIDIEVCLKNTSSRSGDEIVQLYIKDLVSSVTRPEKELKAAQRVTIAANSSVTVMFKLEKKDFIFYDNQGRSVIEPGIFQVFVGNNVESTPLSVSINYGENAQDRLIKG